MNIGICENPTCGHRCKTRGTGKRALKCPKCGSAITKIIDSPIRTPPIVAARREIQASQSQPSEQTLPQKDVPTSVETPSTKAQLLGQPTEPEPQPEQKQEEPTDPEKYGKCPACMATISKGTTTCPECGEDGIEW